MFRRRDTRPAGILALPPELLDYLGTDETSDCYVEADEPIRCIVLSPQTLFRRTGELRHVRYQPQPP